jgi:large subunit ribosomal protein L25
LDIVCLPANLPNYIEVDLADLQVGHSIHLSQLTFPAGVESVQLRHRDDVVVATIPVPRTEAVAEETTAAPVVAPAAAAAPEKK